MPIEATRPQPSATAKSKIDLDRIEFSHAVRRLCRRNPPPNPVPLFVYELSAGRNSGSSHYKDWRRPVANLIKKDQKGSPSGTIGAGTTRSAPKYDGNVLSRQRGKCPLLATQAGKSQLQQHAGIYEVGDRADRNRNSVRQQQHR